jgi:hypothetical protein
MNDFYSHHPLLDIFSRKIRSRISSKPHFFNSRKESEKYYIIRREDLHAGLFSKIITAVGNISYAETNHYIPYIDYKITIENQEQNYWELFFEQPSSQIYDIQMIIASKQYAISEEFPIFRPTDKLYYFQNKMNIQKYWQDIFIRNVRMNSEMTHLIKGSEQQINLENTLGILCRGTDYLALKPSGHPIQPSPQEVIEKAKEMVTRFGYDSIFLATEDIHIAQLFKRTFGKRVIMNQDFFIEYDNRSFLSDLKKKSVFQTIQADIKYLVAIHHLANCKSFIAGRTSGSVGVMLFPHHFESVYFWEKGLYR